MIRRLMFAGILAAALASAQRGGGGGGGMGGDEMGRGGGDMGNMSGMGSSGMPRAQRQSREDQIADKLKLNKEQKEQFAAILSAAREKAAPLRDAMQKQRRTVAEAILRGNSEDDVKKLQADYSAAAAQMTALEAEAFGKIYAMLKPNQQSKAEQGFELMAGMFESTGGAGRGQGSGMGRGQGGMGDGSNRRGAGR